PGGARHDARDEQRETAGHVAEPRGGDDERGGRAEDAAHDDERVAGRGRVTGADEADRDAGHREGGAVHRLRIEEPREAKRDERGDESLERQRKGQRAPAGRGDEEAQAERAPEEEREDEGRA